MPLRFFMRERLLTTVLASSLLAACAGGEDVGQNDDSRADGAPLLFSFEPGPRVAASVTGLGVDYPIAVHTELVERKEPSFRFRTTRGQEVEAALLSSYSSSDGHVSWLGELATPDGGEGTITLTVVDGYFAGHISLPDAAYRIAPVASADEASPSYVLTELAELAETQPAACGGNLVPPLPTEDAAQPAAQVAPIARLDGETDAATTQVDVMVLYTPAVRQRAGSHSAVRVQLQNAIDRTNQASEQSGVAMFMNLIFAAEVAYTESGNGESDLNWLRQDTQVRALRKAHGADLVGLLVADSNVGGLGYTMNKAVYGDAFKDWAYQVTNFRYLHFMPLAHEFGHTMGLQHDPANSAPPSEASRPYAYGHVVSGKFRTIMAYDNTCTEACPIVERWSTPHLVLHGAPLGIAGERHDARALNDNRGAVAAFNQQLRYFNDVNPGYWAKLFIDTLAHNRITTGCGGGNFCPEGLMDRAAMAVFLLKTKYGASYQPPQASGRVFTDVPASHWAAPWIEKLAADGITSGCSSTTYCPEAAVSRAQMAVFMLRAKYGRNFAPPSATGGQFTDVPASHWAAPWIEKLASDGIASGCEEDRFCPEDSVTRAQMAAFLVKTFSNTLPYPL